MSQIVEAWKTHTAGVKVLRLEETHRRRHFPFISVKITLLGNDFKTIPLLLWELKESHVCSAGSQSLDTETLPLPLLTDTTACHTQSVLLPQGSRCSYYSVGWQSPSLSQRFRCSVGCFCYYLEVIIFFPVITSTELLFSIKPPICFSPQSSVNCS